MAFDSQTRNKLQRMVGACRRLLTDEFDDQLQGLYGIYAQDGRVLELEKLTTLDDDNYQIATLLRDRVKHLSSGMASEKQPLAEAVRRVLREQAFTVLNRFAALRMAEERGFVQECVGQGLKSKGFQVFETVARSGLGGAYERYVTFIHGMFDELSLDLGVLFDRWSPFGLLFPREPALLKFFDLLNDPELKLLWKEDETVGWIYQYFNDEAERKKMREESAAPRNSRELAVRNQFFTPRYVVEFLTDNTLGRIWYEMTQGNTKLKEQCRYLVRRPTEIFLKTGEKAPEQPKQDNLSQEDLLKQPVHIPHRPLKDPRTILMLDPACGSMHFGLYAFDLFEVIYEEAWELEKRGVEFQPRPPGMLSLQETYGTKEDFLKDVPRLIFEHNLHGIDIDPRCAQIAGLSLWLRAQKAWQRLGLKPAERPAIKRSNIVCGEPMPGEKELLREFVDNEFPAEERGVVLRLLETIFDKMQLAGEAGSLLKIEEEIRSAIEDARRQWQTARQRPEFFDAAQLASLDKRAGVQQELPAAERAAMAADLRSLTSEDFWQRVEERIYAALRDYAEQAENDGGFQRRLFAEDAARGFAFIDVCRRRYDVVLMNPPYGEASDRMAEYLIERFSEGTNDVFLPFIERAIILGENKEVCGALTSRNFMFNQRMSDFRRDFLLSKGALGLLADLGNNVLDAAVDVAAFTVSKDASQESGGRASFFFNVVNSDNRPVDLLSFVDSLGRGSFPSGVFQRTVKFFRSLPDYRISYSAPDSMVGLFASCAKLAPTQGLVLKGLITGDDERYVRAWQECPASSDHTTWRRFHKGGDYAPFYSDVELMINWGKDGRELKADAERKYGSATRTIKNEAYFGKAGLAWGVNNSIGFAVKAVPAGCVFADIGPNFQPKENASLFKWSGFLNSLRTKMILRLFQSGDRGRFMWIANIVEQIPCPSDSGLAGCAEPAKRATQIFLKECSGDDCSPVFVRPTTELCGGAPTLWSAYEDILAHHKDRERELLQLCSGIDNVVDAAFNRAFSDAEGIRALITDEEQPSAAFLARFGTSAESLTALLLGYALGCTLGRWDIGYATGEKAVPELPDPFAPLPTCPPGQLQNAQGLPAGPEHVPAAYPICIPWDGILVDDPNQPLDIERRVREVIEIIWKDRAEAIEHEACEILGVKSLRDYFRKPTGFFADHLKRYSKSRRQAPIYWPLSTASGSYTLWIYYHRLTDQTLFQCVNDFVKPKQEEVNRDIERLRGELQRADGGSRQQREKLEELEDLAIELKEFHDELLRVAGLPYKPNLNDGVLITASPLWKLFRLPKWQKDLKACWESLEAGEFDWAHLAYTIWPDRVKQVCKKDRSIAIAHGLEHLCEVKAPEKKGKGRKKKEADAELELD